MALMLKTTCRRCGESGYQMDGPLMSGYQPRCEECGQTRLVPWQTDRQSVTEAAGTCDCGGRFTTDAPLRCPSCRSTELDVEHEGIAD